MPELTPTQSSAVSNAKAKAETQVDQKKPSIDTAGIKNQARSRSYFLELQDDAQDEAQQAMSLIRFSKNESGSLVKETVKVTAAGIARISSAEYPQLRGKGLDISNPESVNSAYEATLNTSPKSVYRHNIKFDSASELFEDAEQALSTMGSAEYKLAMQKQYQNEMRIPDPSELRAD